MTSLVKNSKVLFGPGTNSESFVLGLVYHMQRYILVRYVLGSVLAACNIERQRTAHRDARYLYVSTETKMDILIDQETMDI